MMAMKMMMMMMMMILHKTFSEECLPDCTPGLSIMGRVRGKGDHLTASPALKCFNFFSLEPVFWMVNNYTSQELRMLSPWLFEVTVIDIIS